MNLKKVTVGIIASALAMSATCFANYETPATADTEYGEQTTTAQTSAQQGYETTTTTAAQTWETTTTTTWATTTTEPYVPDTPTSSPTTVKLVVSEVKDKQFTAKINIDSDRIISNASISVGYDDSLIEFVKCETNDEAGGMAVDNAFAGKFVYNYVNAEGTDFDGDYATIYFKVADEHLTSTVLYITVTSLDDNNLNAISNQAENGIVKYQDSVPADIDKENYREINIDYSEEPIRPEDMGLSEISDVTVENGEVLIFEDGKFRTLRAGQTKIEVTYEDGSVGHFLITVDEPQQELAESSSEEKSDSSSKAAKSAKTDKNSSMPIVIAVLCVICAGVIIAEYFMITRSGNGKRSEPDEEENSDEEED